VTLADALAGITFVALNGYAVLGGADFGASASSSPRRSARCGKRTTCG
jgi:cytochrome bd-type quinol oxidase subunit 2